MNKLYHILILAILIHCESSKAQGNMIYNPGFEEGKSGAVPGCDYHSSSKDIDQDIAAWYNARTTATLFHSGPNRNSFPDWMDKNCSGVTAGLPYYSRFVYLQTIPLDAPSSDAIRTGLITSMSAGTPYLFKTTYVGVLLKPGVTSPVARERVYLTTYNEHWDKTWGNTKITWAMYPPSYSAGGWVQQWYILPVSEGSFQVSDFYPLVHNIVLTNEQGAFYVDYVELSQDCGNPVLIQNRDFYPYIDELPYKSSIDLRAGYNIGAPNTGLGNVTVHNGANETFIADNTIYLEPGFTAEFGSNFNTVLEPCDPSTPGRAPVFGPDTSFHVIDDSHQTLGCNDTVNIVGIDGDTTSYKSFWWDFGNGQTSTSKSVSIYYATPGSYTVKLALTDSLNVTDTLSKIYIRPDCGRKMTPHNTSLESWGNGQEENGSISVIPNPSNGHFDVSLNNDFNEYISYQVFDPMGRMILNNSIKPGNKLDIDLQAKGVYLLRINSISGSFKTKRLVVD